MTQRRSIFTQDICGVRSMGAVLVCMSLFIGVLVGHAQNPGRTPHTNQAKDRMPEQGRTIFEATCAGCHGLDGRGGERGPDISARQQVVQLSDAQTLDILRQGIPAAGMPPFGSLQTTKLKAVLEYLRHLQGKGAAVALPGNPQKGKAIFFGKARCSECHMVQGVGGFLGRDLTSYGAALSPKEIRNNIVAPGEDMGHSNKTAVVTVRDSQTFSGVIRNEDNFSVQLQSFDGGFHFLKKSGLNGLEFLPEPIMPVDYGTTLTTAEMDDLVSYLVTAAKGDNNGAKRNREDEAE